MYCQCTVHVRPNPGAGLSKAADSESAVLNCGLKEFSTSAADIGPAPLRAASTAGPNENCWIRFRKIEMCEGLVGVSPSCRSTDVSISLATTLRRHSREVVALLKKQNRSAYRLSSTDMVGAYAYRRKPVLMKWSGSFCERLDSSIASSRYEPAAGIGGEIDSR